MGVRIWRGDCRQVLRTLPDDSVHCCVSSPPYFGLRDYGTAEQIGLEASPDAFVEQMVAVFGEVHRILRSDGTFWLNLGDSYCTRSVRRDDGMRSVIKAYETSDSEAGLKKWKDYASAGRAKYSSQYAHLGIKEKDLFGIPWMTAFALRAAGWYLRSEIIWAKPNGMPGSQQDRCTSSHETIFMFSKSRTYWSDFDAIKTPPRESTLVCTAQDLQAQAGSHRANGGAKTNGTMKAVGGLSGSPHGRHALGDALPEKERRSDKQRGHSRQHAGFNDRWDAMERSQQMAQPAMMRDVWFVSPAGYDEAHFAVMPEEIARRCILAGCPPEGTVIDPFGGAGTTALVANRYGRQAISIELNPEYAAMQERRIRRELGLFAQVERHEVAA